MGRPAKLAIRILCNHEHIVMGGVIGRRRGRLCADGNDDCDVELLPLCKGSGLRIPDCSQVHVQGPPVIIRGIAGGAITGEATLHCCNSFLDVTHRDSAIHQKPIARRVEL